MKVLVTGGTGFTGLHLVRALAQRGDDVTVLDISDGDPADTAGLKDQCVNFIKGSVDDKDILSRAVSGQELIFHLASAFRDIHQGPPLFQKIDVEGTRRLLSAAQKSGARRVVHCSTGRPRLPAGRLGPGQ